MSKFTTEQRLSLFESELASIKNPEYRRFLEDVLAAADDYFFDMPASTTGKYHPTFALMDLSETAATSSGFPVNH